ncbi:hypothetical protein [Streptomyces aurantiogriseus]|uniref:Uncharacterized protein n=1 Tax=Streptomyces aurantiogriseus TaxID=66870 RepID=A0A918CQT4_9ACTN|nr:hypothetical protein [Streptomyces aurantiogriseus]GGR34248.1 hypothetical protein GCM10010251_57930 [Streptomyces aurantiogriseus]
MQGIEAGHRRGAPGCVARFRGRHAGLVARREQELRLLERHLGRTTEVLPDTEPGAAAFRPGLVRRLEALPTKQYHALEIALRAGYPAQPGKRTKLAPPSSTRRSRTPGSTSRACSNGRA